MADNLPAPPLTKAREVECINNNHFSSRWLKRRLTIIMIFSGSTILLFWYFGAFGYARPHPPQQQEPIQPIPSRPDAVLVVNLPGYGSFQGTQVLTNLKKTKTFSRPVDAWLNVEYSTQPVGQARFKPVTWPEPFDGTKDATANGPVCFQNMYGSLGQSEACLTINVYRPSGISMDQKLPSLIFLHGGSFVMGSHRSFDGALFVEKSTEPLMVVTVQYRLGALGSLPSKFMQEHGLLNLGIRDQRMALDFLQKYIGNFGGDEDKITLGGQSAGGHSVGIHLFHNYGEDAGKSLFSKAIMSSGSPTARAFPGVGYPLYERHVEDFMDYLNCPSSPSSAALQCLRAAEAHDIQFISSSLYNAHNYNITWPWQPVSPGPLLEKRGSTSGEDGTFFKVPLLISSTTDEGKAFAPQDLRTNDEFLSFWETLVPGLTANDLSDLQTLYPNAEAEVGSLNYVSDQFERVAAAYGDYSYICPVQDTASRLASAGAAVYKARFNTPNWAPSYMGVPHGSDAAYFNGQSGTQFPGIAEKYNAYWASFVVSGDPNTYRLGSSTVWDKYEGTGGRELVVNPPTKGGAAMEEEKNGVRMEQCSWWRDEERADRVNK
ncbi:para-nitrobenzyl esterase [Decorospora gaudefroyi]|uniref:Carboxylic ester hydrolase n=1 Tax=Decorospora gaudefroyi TaxID=184978 RepID=A0A6A5JZL9_9PLEO|nr:para-nitrobenzyl esterase [Decorospora gaudefroyi]